MKTYTSLLTGLLCLLPVISCADNNTSNPSSNINQILPSGDILSISRTADGKSIATHFSTRHANQAELARRIIHILKITKAKQPIIDFAESRLHRHPFLKRSQFKMPLTSKDGYVYKFSYTSDNESGLYILNYQYMGKSKS